MLQIGFIVIPYKSNENDVRNLKNQVHSEMTELTASFNEELKSLKESLNIEVKQKFKTITDNMQVLQLNLTEIDSYVKSNQRIWTLQGTPWIKTELLLRDKNFATRINHLLIDLEMKKINMQTFTQSTYNLAWEKQSIKLHPIDEDRPIKKVTSWQTLKIFQSKR